MKWFPSSSNTDCLRTNANGLAYEDFSCLYPTLGKTFFGFEKDFNPETYYYFMKDHPIVPVAAVLLYGALIVAGQRYFRDRKPWNLRMAMAAWNLGLSVFSAMGVFRVAPQIVHLYSHYSVAQNFCMDPEQSFGSDGGAGLWMLLFCISKIAELFDTFFIVVHKKPLILLHWYHHVSVLLMCWHGYVTKAPAGIIFGCVNYAVHSIMYFYYFLMAVKCKPKAFKAVYITLAQISQMVVGLVVTAIGFYFLWSVQSDGSGEACHLRLEQNMAVVVMYASYLFLFLDFFFDRYKGKKQQVSNVPITLQEKMNRRTSGNDEATSSVASVSSDGGSNAELDTSVESSNSSLDCASPSTKLKAL